jgi:hypothetical protein
MRPVGYVPSGKAAHVIWERQPDVHYNVVALIKTLEEMAHAVFCLWPTCNRLVIVVNDELLVGTDQTLIITHNEILPPRVIDSLSNHVSVTALVSLRAADLYHNQNQMNTIIHP